MRDKVMRNIWLAGVDQDTACIVSIKGDVVAFDVADQETAEYIVDLHNDKVLKDRGE